MGCGRKACSEVSMEGRSPAGDWLQGIEATFSSPAEKRWRARSRSTGRKMGARSASWSQVPEALTQSTPSILTELLPPAPWISSGSRPTRADIAFSADRSRASRWGASRVIVELFPPCERGQQKIRTDARLACEPPGGIEHRRLARRQIEGRSKNAGGNQRRRHAHAAPAPYIVVEGIADGENAARIR